MAGIYEDAPGDVPRIAALPCLDRGRGVRRRAVARFSTAAAGAVRGYRQVLDMRAGTVRTSYEWVTGTGARPWRSRRSSPGRIRTSPPFGSISHPARRVGCGSDSPSSGRPPPRRLPLARLTVRPGVGPADIWYPGHMAVRSSAATTRAIGRAARAHLDARGPNQDGRPGRQKSPGPPASAGRPREPRARETVPGSRWPSTRVAGRTYTLHPDRERDRATRARIPRAAVSRRRRQRTRAAG